jgi:glycosyltransferase involved in cell wall biosynthesis
MADSVRAVKILRLIARLNTGGPALHTILLTQGLNGGRFSSCLITGMVARGEGDMEYYAESRGVVPIVLSELGRDLSFRNDLRTLWKLYRLFRREEPDIVHTHTAKAGALGRLAGIVYNAGRILSGGRPAKFVHSYHGHIFRGYFSPWKSRLFVFIERLLARMTHRIVTVSESIKRELAEVYRICPLEKITVVPLGVDLSWIGEMARHRSALRREFRVPLDRLTIGIIGRITEIKNHRHFLSGARNLIGKANIHFFIVGGGELQEEMIEVVHEFGLRDLVTFTGWQRDPAKIYADLDIVCLTSLNEGTPVVLIEAMAAGRPFVATDVGGVRDLMVGEGMVHPDGFEIFANGVLIQPNDIGALVAALSFLAERRDIRREMGAIGQQSARGKYSHARLLEDMDSLYTDLLGLGSRRA